MIYYQIRTPTLKAIKEAIEKVNSKNMPSFGVSEEHDIHFILRETLVKIADTVRTKEGSASNIPVVELADRIISAFAGSAGGGTSAILGVAVLGKAKLGNSTGLAKLSTPVIYLKDGVQKLSTPSIYLETAEEANKLTTPVIQLVTVADLTKLDTPVIRLETEDDSADEATVVIVTQPQSQVCTVGANVTFTVVAEGDDLTYQWYYKYDLGNEWYTLDSVYGKTATAKFRPASADEDMQVYCVVTDANGNTATTDTVTLTVKNVQLATPVIYLETLKLATPVIQLLEE